MKLTAEDFAKLEDKKLANILRKLAAGKTLTAREDAILARHRTATEPQVQTSGPAPLKSGFAHTWDDLAQALGVSRKALQNWRDPDRRPDLQGRLPTPRADGRHDIAAWATAMSDFGLGKGAGGEDEDTPPELSERALKLREWKLRLDRAEYELAKAQELSLPIAEFDSALGIMLSAFRALLNRLPSRAASKIMSQARTALLRTCKAGLTPTVFAKVERMLEKTPALDFADLEEALMEEVQVVLVTLHGCDYLRPPAPASVQGESLEQSAA